MCAEDLMSRTRSTTRGMNVTQKADAEAVSDVISPPLRWIDSVIPLLGGRAALPGGPRLEMERGVGGRAHRSCHTLVLCRLKLFTEATGKNRSFYTKTLTFKSNIRWFGCNLDVF